MTQSGSLISFGSISRSPNKSFPNLSLSLSLSLRIHKRSNYKWDHHLFDRIPRRQKKKKKRQQNTLKQSILYILSCEEMIWMPRQQIKRKHIMLCSKHAWSRTFLKATSDFHCRMSSLGPTDEAAEVDGEYLEEESWLRCHCPAIAEPWSNICW